MPFSIESDMAIMYPTKLLIHSFRAYLLSAYYFTHWSKHSQHMSKQCIPKPLPSWRLHCSEGDRHKQDKK